MKELTKEFKCKYLLPCGHCDKFDKVCNHNQPIVLGTVNTDIKEILDTQTKTATCIHEWEPVNSINTAGCVYRCRKCGAMQTEPITRGLQKYITTSSDNDELNKKYSLWNSDSTDPCEHCPNNPKNGGSGVCHCILGLPKVTCGTIVASSCDGASKDYLSNMEPTVDSKLTTNVPLYTSGYISVNTPTEVDTILDSNITTSATTSEFEQLTIEGL